MILQWHASFGVGTLTGVNDQGYKPPFPFTAKLNKLTVRDRPQLSPEDITSTSRSCRRPCAGRRRGNDPAAIAKRGAASVGR
jgi:hypothetical protein